MTSATKPASPPADIRRPRLTGMPGPLILLYAAAAYAVFLFVTGYAAGFIGGFGVPKDIDDGTGDGHGSLHRFPYCPSHWGLLNVVMLYTAMRSLPMSATYAIVPFELKATLYGKLIWLTP